MIFEAIEKNVQGHWNQAIQGLTVNVWKMFQEMDAELFEECHTKCVEKKTRAQELEEQRQMTWKKLEAVAKWAKDIGFDLLGEAE